MRQLLLPPGVESLIEMLSLTDPAPTAAWEYEQFDDQEWNDFLEICDQHQMTLVLGRFSAPTWPAWVVRRLERNRRAAGRRLARFHEALSLIDRQFRSEEIEYAVLKGPAHAADYSETPERQQSDIDLYCRPEQLQQAQAALRRLGWESLDELAGLQEIHLAPMVSDPAYEWNGDYFDENMPLAVELHFQFWNERGDHVAVPRLDGFFDRRVRSIDGAFSELDPIDEFCFRALHVLRHLLHGNLRIYHVYELAWFLHHHAGEDAFWVYWSSRHDDRLRELCAISARLAREWFDCSLHPLIQAETEDLSHTLQEWFYYYSFAPLEAMVDENKSELWLHLAITGQKIAVLRKKLLPLRIPVVAEADYAPGGRGGAARRRTQLRRYAAYISRRSLHHLKALAPTLGQGVSWWWRLAGLDSAFVRFLGSAALFTFGMFLFVLIYNLYLIDHGYAENFLGLVTASMTAGGLAGALPAGWLGRRLEINRTLRLCFLGSAGVSLLRAIVPGAPLLLASAFLGGAFLALWMVTMAPAVSRLVPEPHRPTAFSLFFGSGIGLGIVGGLVGGHLPEWFSAVGIPLSAIGAKRAVLITGCVFMALAVVPLRELWFPPAGERTAKVYPRGAFIRRYLTVFVVWNLATGAFNPFFNAYLARLGATTARIGVAFSAGQVAQLVAVILAPWAYRRFGLVAGISLMMALTGISLGGLALSHAVTAGVLAYCLYMAFQWMSEPGMYSLLMNNVRPEEQSGAAALNFLAISGAQAVSAALSGALHNRFGYSVGLAAAALVGLLAALLLSRLLREK